MSIERAKWFLTIFKKPMKKHNQRGYEMKKYFFVLAILVSQSGFAEDIYKCVDEKGNQVFSNTKCPEATIAEKVEYEEATLDEQLAALTPGVSKITNITRKDGDTLIDFQFATMDELEEFVRLSQKLSAKHVNLTKVVKPKNAEMGKALIHITPSAPAPAEKTELKQ